VRPRRHVDAVRVEAAQALLSAGTAPVEEVAREAGSGSSETVRRVFRHTLGVSLTGYRARFRTTDPRDGDDPLPASRTHR